MRSTALVIALSAAISFTSFAQTPNPAPQENGEVIANDRAYEDAYAKGDAKALADFFADDAEYTTDDGRTYSGRAAIQEAITAAFLSNTGAKLAIKAESVKILAPEVVVEKGATTVTAKNGEISSSLYTAFHVKKDGKWKISQLIESPVPNPTPHECLSELDWLIGDWEEADKSNDLSVRSQVSWARGGNFITRNITVKRAGATKLEGWQVIGWDPVEEHIRSWTFDGAGGFSEGTWTRDGQRWLLRETGIAPDGSRTTTDITIGKVSADRFTWEASNRTLNGEPQPGVGRIEINRVKGH